jgi:hypothetical protein
MTEPPSYQSWPTAAEVLRAPPYRIKELDKSVRDLWRAPFEQDALLQLRVQAAWLEARVESVLASWGECAWTARDCLTICHHPDGRITLS